MRIFVPTLLAVALMAATAQAQQQNQWTKIPCSESLVKIDDRLECTRLSLSAQGILELTRHRILGEIEGRLLYVCVIFAGAQTNIEAYGDQWAESQIKSLFSADSTFSAYGSKGDTGWIPVRPGGQLGNTRKSCIGFAHAGPPRSVNGLAWDSRGYICHRDQTPVTVEYLNKVLAAVTIGRENKNALGGPVQPFPAP